MTDQRPDVPARVIDAVRRSSGEFLVATGVARDRRRETLALGVGVIALVASALVVLLIFRLRPLPITGEESIGLYSAIASAIVAAMAFIAGRWVVHAPGGTHPVLNVLDIAALAFAHGVISLVTWSLLSGVVESGLPGAPVFGFPSMLIAGTTAGLSAYIAFTSGTRMNASSLAVLLPLFLLEGLFASMLTAGDRQWWKRNLSALGETDDPSAIAFNVTLVVGGFIVTTLARYATRRIPTAPARGLARVRLGLVVVGLSLMLVGALPADAFYWPHTLSAAAMAIVFGIVVVFVPRWIPGLPRLFIFLGWVLVVILVVQFVLFATGYYTLTAVELVVGILVVAWISLFVRITAARR